MKKTILIVNRNLAFVFRLGRILEAAGHCVLPARSIPDAKKLLSDFRSPVDLVLIHRATAGAHCLIEELRQAQGQIAMIDLCGDELPKPGSPESLAVPRMPTFCLPRLHSPVSTTECLGMVEGFLTGKLAYRPREFSP